MKNAVKLVLALICALLVFSFGTGVALAAINVEQELGTTDDFQRLGVFTLSALAGVFLHYFKKWLRKEISGGLFHYLFVDNTRQTILMVMTLLGVIATMFVGKQIQGIQLLQLVIMGTTTGYTIDSATNKGAEPLPGDGYGQRS